MTKMENRYIHNPRTDFSKTRNGDLCVSIYQTDESVIVNHHITKNSFLDFLYTHYRKEINQKWVMETKK